MCSFIAAQAQVESPNPLLATIDSITLEPPDDNDTEGVDMDKRATPSSAKAPDPPPGSTERLLAAFRGGG